MSTIESLIVEASNLASSGKLEEAMIPYLSAKEQAFKSGDTINYIRCCQGIAVCLDNLDRSLDAANELELAISAASLDATTSAGLLINQGVCLLRARMFKASEEAFSRSISIIRKVPPKLRTPEMHNINDIADENRHLVREIMKAEAEGKTISLNKDDS